jgi:hypothetical protein
MMRLIMVSKENIKKVSKKAVTVQHFVKILSNNKSQQYLLFLRGVAFDK